MISANDSNLPAVLSLIELKDRKFIKVCDDAESYVDNGKLLGDQVSKAFPSASAELREAGNCLAVECHTAAVFHLMRAVSTACGH